MFKYLKIIFKNILILILILFLIELFFLLNSFIQFIPQYNTNKKIVLKPPTDQEILEQFGIAATIPIPNKFKYKINPDLNAFGRSDLVVPTAFLSTYFGGNLKNQKINSQLKIKNTNLFVYDVQYLFNNFGFRQVQKMPKSNYNKSQFVIAAGCSYTFGQGVDQGLDYPSQLSEKLGPDWSVYNYGLIGSSPSEFLHSSENNNSYLTQIKESEGIFIWLYIDHHMKRMICPISCYREINDRFIFEKPEYAIEQGRLIYFGKIKEERRVLRKFLKILSLSKTIQFFNSDFPDMYSAENYQLLFSILNQSILNIEKSGKKINKKIIVVYDNSEPSGNLKIQANLAGFEFVNFQKLKDYRRDVNFSLQADFHPSSEAYWLLSEVIRNNLQKDDNN